MQEISRNDVRIDICSGCRGVWLDRGELEKLLSGVRRVEEDWHRENAEQYRDHGKPYRKKKKFEGLFDIFD
jgi:hypothetical protein